MVQWRLRQLAPVTTASPTEGVEDGGERGGEGQQVAVVDAAVVELACEVAEQSRPVLAPCGGRLGDLHPPFDNPDRRQPGGRSPGLLPGSLPAGGGTPFRGSTCGPDADRPSAPPTARRGVPPGLRRGLDPRR